MAPAFDTILMLDSNDRYFSMHEGVASFTKTAPDTACELVVERLTNGKFYLKTSEGFHLKHHPKKRDHIYHRNRGQVIEFTLIEKKDRFALCADRNGFLRPQINSKGRLGLGSYSESCLVQIQDGALERKFSDINYLFGSAKTDYSKYTICTTTVRNDGREKDVLTILNYKFERSNIGSWKGARGEKLEDDKVPVLEEREIVLSFERKKKPESETEEASAQANMSPGFKAIVKIVLFQANIEVPFTYTETVLYRNGQHQTHQKKGIYSNTETYAHNLEMSHKMPI